MTLLQVGEKVNLDLDHERCGPTLEVLIQTSALIFYNFTWLDIH
jgi:hypothetical protein